MWTIIEIMANVLIGATWLIVVLPFKMLELMFAVSVWLAPITLILLGGFLWNRYFRE